MDRAGKDVTRGAGSAAPAIGVRRDAPLAMDAATFASLGHQLVDQAALQLPEHVGQGDEVGLHPASAIHHRGPAVKRAAAGALRATSASCCHCLPHAAGSRGGASDNSGLSSGSGGGGATGTPLSPGYSWVSTDAPHGAST